MGDSYGLLKNSGGITVQITLWGAEENMNQSARWDTGGVLGSEAVEVRGTKVRCDVCVWMELIWMCVEENFAFVPFLPVSVSRVIGT